MENKKVKTDDSFVEIITDLIQDVEDTEDESDLEFIMYGDGSGCIRFHHPAGVDKEYLTWDSGEDLISILTAIQHMGSYAAFKEKT